MSRWLLPGSHPSVHTSTSGREVHLPPLTSQSLGKWKPEKPYPAGPFLGVWSRPSSGPWGSPLPEVSCNNNSVSGFAVQEGGRPAPSQVGWLPWQSRDPFSVGVFLCVSLPTQIPTACNGASPTPPLSPVECGCCESNGRLGHTEPPLHPTSPTCLSPTEGLSPLGIPQGASQVTQLGFLGKLCPAERESLRDRKTVVREE